MTFLWPVMLLGLLGLPILLALYVLQVRRRRAALARLGNLAWARASAGRRAGMAAHIPWILFLVSISGLIVAMARPQAEVRLPRIEGTVILAFDVSGSMAADDLQPTRMEAAKAAARAFVQQQPRSVQIGIVAFSDTGFSIQAPGNDQDQVLAAINRLTPQRGTSLGNGILVSLSTIASAEAGTHFYTNLTPAPTPSPTPVPSGFYSPASIVLLSDGENNETPDPLAAARLAAQRGVRIYTVGIGSAAGSILHVNGLTVRTRLDESTLQRIAQTTGGTYFSAQSAQELIHIYGSLNRQAVFRPENIEITAILAGAGAALLLAGGAYSLLAFGRIG